MAATLRTREGQPAVSTLKVRANFLAASRARRMALPSLVLQARQRGAAEPAGGVRIGYTCSKKVGNSVMRNRAKRRLRAAAREVLARDGRPGWDYVLIGRRDATAQVSFADMVAELSSAVAAIHGKGARP